MKKVLLGILAYTTLIIGCVVYFGTWAWLLMFVWNFIAAYFGLKTITFTISWVIVVFIHIIKSLLN